MKFLQAYLFLLLLNNFSGIHPTQNNTGIVVEDFENLSKPAYAADNISGKLGEWYLDDALIGLSESDNKDGHKCVRVRNNGIVSMRFDLSGPLLLTMKTATYGHDDSSLWSVFVSYDSGLNYQQIGQNIATKSTQLITSKIYIAKKNKFRIEFRKISGGKNRINLDDIAFISNANLDHQTISVSKPQSIDNKQINIPQSLENDNGNLLLGNPDNAKHDPQFFNHYLIDAQYYTISYSREKSEPNWVSWHLCMSDLGASDRQNDFRYDSTLPNGWYAVPPEVYKHTGFDKGHNCPSGDRTSNSTANSVTFLMDNIIPQAPNNNQHVWEHLETYCRTQVKKKREAYIICGNYGKGGVGKDGYMESIDNGRICVPSNLWKIIIIIPEGDNDLSRINSNTRIIAVDIPNKNDVSNNWMNYICTVHDIEMKTGFKFLSKLPNKVTNILKNEIFKGGD
jgi:endonuclease G